MFEFAQKVVNWNTACVKPTDHVKPIDHGPALLAPLHPAPCVFHQCGLGFHREGYAEQTSLTCLLHPVCTSSALLPWQDPSCPARLLLSQTRCVLLSCEFQLARACLLYVYDVNPHSAHSHSYFWQGEESCCDTAGLQLTAHHSDLTALKMGLPPNFIYLQHRFTPATSPHSPGWELTGSFKWSLLICGSILS